MIDFNRREHSEYYFHLYHSDWSLTIDIDNDGKICFNDDLIGYVWDDTIMVKSPYEKQTYVDLVSMRWEHIRRGLKLEEMDISEIENL